MAEENSEEPSSTRATHVASQVVWRNFAPIGSLPEPLCQPTTTAVNDNSLQRVTSPRRLTHARQSNFLTPRISSSSLNTNSEL